jgi:hypothetical protein
METKWRSAERQILMQCVVPQSSNSKRHHASRDKGCAGFAWTFPSPRNTKLRFRVVRPYNFAAQFFSRWSCIFSVKGSQRMFHVLETTYTSHADIMFMNSRPDNFICEDCRKGENHSVTKFVPNIQVARPVHIEYLSWLAKKYVSEHDFQTDRWEPIWMRENQHILSVHCMRHALLCG